MANPVVAQIIKSGAIVWNAPVGETWPDETSVAFGAAWGGNWTRVGYTKEPLSCLYEDEYHTVNVEEVLAGVRRFRTSEACTLETVLAELTATYISLVAGGQGTVSETAAGAAQQAYEQVTLGGEAVVDEGTYGFEGRYLNSSGAEFALRVFVPLGNMKLNGALEFSKKGDDYTGVPMQVLALADTDNSDRVLVFQRITAAVT